METSMIHPVFNSSKMQFASVYQLFGTIAIAVAQSASTALTSSSAIATHTVAVGEVKNRLLFMWTLLTNWCF
jgi:hypothetical protein